MPETNSRVVVTLLFSDIEGSTQLWERFGEAMEPALERHDELVVGAVARHGGRVFKKLGDAVCAAFNEPVGALLAAVEAQRAIARQDWSEFGRTFPQLAVRMGLHTGEAAQHDGDYFGVAVSRAARLGAVGNGGQILLSARTWRAARRDALPPDFRFKDLGEHRLRDLRHSERIYQLVADGMPDDTRPPRTAGALSTHDRIVVLEPGDPTADDALPDTTLLGRELPDTLSALSDAVTADSERVVLTADQMAAVAQHRPQDWCAYRLTRIAQWSLPQYRLDSRFVALSLHIEDVDLGPRLQMPIDEPCCSGLRELLSRIDDQAIVVLGPPGSGKSTLLRHLELEIAVDALRARSELKPATFYVSLRRYSAAEQGQNSTEPGAWLAEEWSVRYPLLGPLDELLRGGSVTLLLDGLSEMPGAGTPEHWRSMRLWQRWLLTMDADYPGNRCVFSCRSSEYVQPLGSPGLRVPQVHIEPLANEQIVDFLRLYSPGRWREIWRFLEHSAQLEVMRSPYWLALLVEQVEATGDLPSGHAALLTGFVRHALRREVQKGSAPFVPGPLLTERDLRQITAWRWRGPYDLPEDGPLMAELARLAAVAQSRSVDAPLSLGRKDAAAISDPGLGEAVIDAGQALAVLDEDLATAQVGFASRMLQEYFAARQLARRPDGALVAQPWRLDAVRPSLAELLDDPHAGGNVPDLPCQPWERTALLAATMADDPKAFVSSLMDANLPLAGRAAAQPELRDRLDEAFANELRSALVRRSRDWRADLRARIAAGRALGALGDPRFELCQGPYGAYLLPPLVEIDGGSFPIGQDAPIQWVNAAERGSSADAVPAHRLHIDGFQIGQMNVTNAEWAHFMAAGGYENERWWETADARAWRQGELTGVGHQHNSRIWWHRLKADPGLLDRLAARDQFVTETSVARWRQWLQLDEVAFERVLQSKWAPRRHTEPQFWRDRRFNHPSQPAVGISWYEARAYCRWLSGQVGRRVRLPTEVEWEAATRGRTGRAYAWGSHFDRLACNTLQTRLGRTTPVGVFPEGDTPEGVCDLTGNVHEWTSSAIRGEGDACRFCYPYDALDGREDPELGPDIRRVVRGGCWTGHCSLAAAAFRDKRAPDARSATGGFRIVVDRQPA